MMKRWLATALLLLAAVPVSAGQLTATWTAPTTNTDGTPLTDLGSYRVYWFLFPATPCPGTQFIVVSPVTPAPGPNTVVSTNLPNLTQGMTYNAQVTAVDTAGNESACSSMTSAVARADTPLPLGSTLRITFVPSPPPPPPVSFTVVGLVSGQTVKGLLRVNAVPTSGSTVNQGFRFDLLRADGTLVQSNAEGASPYCFVGDPGSLPCTAFDTLTVPNGTYSLRIVYTPPVGATVTQTIPFTIAN